MGGYINWQWATMISVFVLILSLAKTRSIPTFVWLYFLINSAYFAFHPLTIHFGVYDMNASFKVSALQFVVYLLLIPAIIRLTSTKLLERIIVWLVMFNCVWIWLRQPSFFTGYTLDAAIMALTVPLFIHKRHYIRLTFLLVTILSAKGAVSIGVLATIAIGYAIAWRERSILVLSAFFILLGFVLQGRNLFDMNGRAEIWGEHLRWWYAQDHFWFGIGPGTYEIMGLQLPIGTHRFFWAHNDWFELLFEFGILGMKLGLLLYGYIVWHVRKSPHTLAFFLALGACMLVYSPMQSIPVWILACIMWKIRAEEPRPLV